MEKLCYGMVGGGAEPVITCVAAKKDGSFTADMIDFPTVNDGADGVRFIHVCLDPNRKGNVWITL